MKADLVIMALGNASNPIIKDSEPELHTTTWGTIDLERTGSQETSLHGVYSGGDAARGGSTAINAAGDGQAAAREIIGHVDVPGDGSPRWSGRRGSTPSAPRPSRRSSPRPTSPTASRRSPSARPSSPPRPGPASSSACFRWPDGELIPLTLADWDAEAGTICLVVQGVGTSSIEMNAMQVGDVLRRHRRAARPTERDHRAPGRRDGRLHRRRARPAAGLPDHARAPAGREPRHAHRRVPQRRACCSGPATTSAWRPCSASSATSSR